MAWTRMLPSPGTLSIGVGARALPLVVLVLVLVMAIAAANEHAPFPYSSAALRITEKDAVRKKELLSNTRTLTYRNSPCCGFGNNLGGLVAVKRLATLSKRTLLVDYLLLHRGVIEFPRMRSLTDGAYEQVILSVRSLANHNRLSFHFDAHPELNRGVLQNQSIAQLMSEDAKYNHLVFICARIFACLNQVKVEEYAARWNGTKALSDNRKADVQSLFHARSWRTGFKEKCAERFRSAGLSEFTKDHFAHVKAETGRTLVALQIRYMVDSSAYTNLNATSRSEYEKTITTASLQTLRRMQAHHELNASETDLYLTSDRLELLVADRHTIEQLRQVGIPRYPAREKFRDSRHMDVLPLCDWFLIGEADFAVVGLTTFSYSAVLRSSRVIAYKATAKDELSLVTQDSSRWR
ncbi:hypothetical protein FVE85_4810 [Porphyridium purpureum]|uniref:Uncharacterized protein n=1 Tax=Porphyridium purpureum TaxID=35688 RepID=A0A5J4YS83_PORPP|nr:hypothetical protein FVE85_4810 [Porphyridium purpureum]|eukprot:POR3284..scf236_6